MADDDNVVKFPGGVSDDRVPALRDLEQRILKREIRAYIIVALTHDVAGAGEQMAVMPGGLRSMPEGLGLLEMAKDAFKRGAPSQPPTKKAPPPMIVPASVVPRP